MKKLFFLFNFMALPMLVSAYDASVNGLYYNLDANSRTAEVTKGDNRQSGVVNIPETITIGAVTYTVTSIGDDAFEYCRNLTTVSMPATITHIGKTAFYQCKMTSVNIPNSVTEIDEYAFRNCTELTSINLPNSVTKISDGVFKSCWSLETVTIPSSITSIGRFAFSSCSSLKSITIPNSVTSIGDGAFNECIHLANISLPESITSVGFNAFDDTPWYYSQPDGMLYINKVAYKYKGTMAENTIIELNEGTTEISGQAFYNCQGLKSIKIPETVKQIGVSAFSGCSNLESVNILNSITVIPDYCFQYCTGLTNVIIPNSVTAIGDFAFAGCSSLTNVIIPNSVTTIGHSAFGDCSCLTSVIIPDNVTAIGSRSFQNCTGLTSITISNSVSTIGYEAFYGCNGLESVVVPASVTSIGNKAFYNKNLKAIVIAAGNPVYDSRNDCNAIIETATNSLIFGCQGSFIPDGVEIIADHAFCLCEGLTSINIPASVRIIEEFAFDTCPLLGSVTLNEGLVSIGKQAFCRCSALDAIVLPSTLTEIGEFAFSSTNLAIVTSLIDEPFVINANVFLHLYSRATLYIPVGTRAKYESVEAWSQFTNIVEVTKQCEKPTIVYEEGKLKYECATEGAEFITSISDADVKTHVGSEVCLTATYVISVYAKSVGYKDSDISTATLCWIESTPETEGIEDGFAKVRANAILIKNSKGTLYIQGAPVGNNIGIYTMNGLMVGSAKSEGTLTSIATSLRSGEIAIVKIGNNSVKVLME